MPVLVATLLGGLINIAGSLAGQVLIALGVSVITYTGIDASLAFLKAQALGALTGAPGELVSLLAFMKVGVCINIITSAMLARQTLQGLTSGTFKRWVLK